jgi:hypothetical protein
MLPSLRGLAAQQNGVFTRRQAVACGCTERELKTRTGARGDWVVVRRGAYADRSVWETLGEDDRYRLRVRAAVLCAATPATVTHTSAAAFLRFPMRPHWRELVHVTRPGVHGGRTEGGVKHHLARLYPGEVQPLHGIRLSDPAWTAMDVAREHGFEDGVVAADAALRSGATRADFARALEVMTCWPRITGARAAADVADGGAETIGETLTRLLVLELGVGVPETQFTVVADRRSARVDLRLRRHLFEFDGKVKYLGRDHGGVADRRPEQVVWDEKRREDWLRNHDGGYGMSRVVWSDLFGRARDETKRRLAREYAESERRYGHLAA